MLYFITQKDTTIHGHSAFAMCRRLSLSLISIGERFEEAKNAGADLVGGDDLIQQIKDGFMEFDKLIASPDMMPKVLPGLSCSTQHVAIHEIEQSVWH